jgi:Omp85 superfamily domain
MKRLCTVALLLVLGLWCARPARAFSLIDPNTWPASLNPHHWPFTVVPVPEVASDPNSGVTYGLLLAGLFTNKQGDITEILAPDLNNNSTLGFGGNFRFLSYPSADEQWSVMGGLQRKIASDVDLYYALGRTHRSTWSFSGHFYFERDPTERFFGIGNSSSEGNQSNFTTQQVYFEGILGYNLTPHLQIAIDERPRYVRIWHGAYNNLPSIFVQFPEVKGLGGGTELLNQIQMSYDTRNSIDIPTDGGYYLIYASIADRSLGSSVSYTRFGIDLHHYFPIGRNITLATHGYLQYTPSGNETPFWAMGRLGGESSLLFNEETLRGYGAGRFVDNDVFDANAEMRIRVFDTDIFNTHGIIELAPFLDAGRVFHTVNTNFLEDLHPVGGIGFRGIAEPFVVGYVDVGWGGEGVAVFSGIDYPF